MISPLAFIDPAATIGNNVEIGPFCFIDKDVVIGDDCVLMNSVTLLSGSRIGRGNTFFPGAVIGAIPQDLKFRGEVTTTEIGDYNTFRENTTVNRGTAAKGRTVVGSHNLLMEGMHIGHDAIVGNRCIIGNSSKLAGEVEIADHAILSANVLVHQFCRIGSFAIVGGGSRTSQDIPPYITAAREPIAYCGLNLVGLRRNGFEREKIDQIHDTYRLMYNFDHLFEERIADVEAQIPSSPERDYIIEFFRSSSRGVIK